MPLLSLERKGELTMYYSNPLPPAPVVVVLTAWRPRLRLVPLVVLILEEALSPIVPYARTGHDSVNMSFPPGTNELVQSAARSNFLMLEQCLIPFWMCVRQDGLWSSMASFWQRKRGRLVNTRVAGRGGGMCV